MQIKLELMNEGDSVLNTWENKVSILRANGDVEIFTIDKDENTLPRVSKETILITYGKGTITLKNDKKDIEIGTF